MNSGIIEILPSPQQFKEDLKATFWQDAMNFSTLAIGICLIAFLLRGLNG